MSNYPVLVYGTLRPSGSNYGHFLSGRTTNERKISVSGFRMYGGKGYPYVTRGESTDRIVGTLCDIDPYHYDEVLEGLDFLEGFFDVGSERNHYDRILMEFTLNGEIVKAWTYIASDQVIDYVVNDLPVVEHGDWLKFYADHIEIWRLEDRQRRYSAWVRDNEEKVSTTPVKTRMSRARKKRAKALA